jgi:hypothetical protein
MGIQNGQSKWPLNVDFAGKKNKTVMIKQTNIQTIRLIINGSLGLLMVTVAFDKSEGYASLRNHSCNR